MKTERLQSVVGAFPLACEVDSRFRGNDGTWVFCASQMDPLLRLKAT